MCPNVRSSALSGGFYSQRYVNAHQIDCSADDVFPISSICHLAQCMQQTEQDDGLVKDWRTEVSKLLQNGALQLRATTDRCTRVFIVTQQLLSNKGISQVAISSVSNMWCGSEIVFCFCFTRKDTKVVEYVVGWDYQSVCWLYIACVGDTGKHACLTVSPRIKICFYILIL